MTQFPEIKSRKRKKRSFLNLEDFSNLRFLVHSCGPLNVEKIIAGAKKRDWDGIVDFMENHLDKYYGMIS